MNQQLKESLNELMELYSSMDKEEILQLWRKDIVRLWELEQNMQIPTPTYDTTVTCGLGECDWYVPSPSTILISNPPRQMWKCKTCNQIKYE